MFDLTSLAIFETVVATGSFTQAAAQGYLTPPAVMHRIDELEKLVGTPLFMRTAQGVTLTPAGQRLHAQAPQLIQASESLMASLQHQVGQQQKTIRIGTSALNPASRHGGLWARLSRRLPDYRFQFIPLETLNMGFPELYRHLGEQVDLLVGPSGFESTATATHFYPMGRAHFTVTVRHDAALAQKDVITPADLNGRALALVPRGAAAAIDRVYEELDRSAGHFTAVPADAHYTIETFNRFIQGNQGLLTFDCWDNVLPGTVARPLAVATTIPYGIMAPLRYTPAMKTLAACLVEELNQ